MWPAATTMATVYPKDVFEPCTFGMAELPFNHHHELTTLRLLRDALPDHYTIFHSAHVAWWNGRGASFSEADFVIVNRDGDALMIEQKNGRLEETGSGLFKSYDDGPSDVVRQMVRCTDGLRDGFNRATGAKLVLSMLLYCPDHTLGNINAAALPRELVVDRSRAAHLVTIIEKALGRGTGGSKHGPQHQSVIEFLRNEFQLNVSKERQMELHRISAERLTGGLVDALRRFEMQPLRLRVEGTAGCGKTDIARHYVEQWSEQGRRTLLVCFNNALATALQERFGPKAKVATILGFCREFMESRGETIDFAKATGASFWSDFLDRMEALIITEPPDDAWLFDSLIVDEGQDFEPGQFQILRFFLRENAGIVWLEDRRQNLYNRPAFAKDGFVTFHADGNFRTPLRIASFVQRALDIPFNCLNPVPGEGVHIHEYRDEKHQRSLLEQRIDTCLRRGFTADQIVVLSACRAERAVFHAVDRLAAVALRRFRGYDSVGRPMFTDGHLLCESIWRYKGLEAPVIIMTDVDPVHGHSDKGPVLAPREVTALYCGMTRATWRLELLMARKNPFVDPFKSIAAACRL